jgi:hypothetical protein
MTDDEAWERLGKAKAEQDVQYIVHCWSGPGPMPSTEWFSEYYKRTGKAYGDCSDGMTGQQVMCEEWDKKAAKRKTELRRPWLTGWRA